MSAFQHLKDVLTQQTIITYSDSNKDTELFVNRSKKMEWLILAQKDRLEKNYYKPIRYDSRATTAD